MTEEYMNAEEIASYIRGLEHENAILKWRSKKRMQKIRTLRDANSELKKDVDRCKALWGVRV